MVTAAPMPGGGVGPVGWAEFVAQAPDLAESVAGRFAAHTHLTMATLRADGAPRISGTEVVIAAGRMWLGAMPESVKVRDLRRDPRVAVHSGSDDPPAWTGDAKVSGIAVEIDDRATKDAYLAAQQAANQRSAETAAEPPPSPPTEPGSGRTREPSDGEPAELSAPEPLAFALFEVRLTDASTVSLGEPPDHIVVTSWRPGHPVTRTERR